MGFYRDIFCSSSTSIPVVYVSLSTGVYLPSATYLNLVNAELLVLAFFFIFVLSGWGSPLSCCCADINTTYSMGTAAIILPIFLLLVPPFTLRLGSMPVSYTHLTLPTKA